MSSENNPENTTPTKLEDKNNSSPQKVSDLSEKQSSLQNNQAQSAESSPKNKNESNKSGQKSQPVSEDPSKDKFLTLEEEMAKLSMLRSETEEVEPVATLKQFKQQLNISFSVI